MTDPTGFIVVLVVVVFLFVMLGVCARRSFLRRMRSVELHAPLLESEDRRLDAALRDAEEGFNACEVCGFENFKRFHFCTVCGEPLADEAEDAAAKLEKKSLRLALTPLFRRESRVQLATSAPPTPDVSERAARRRRRAQRRKEWTRKLDVEGRVFWFRDGRFTADTRFPCFVLRLELTGERSDGASRSRSQLPSPMRSEELLSSPQTGSDIPEPDQEDDHDLEDNETVRDAVPSPPLVGSVEERITSLRKEIEAMQVTIIPASDVDASKLPLDIEVASRAALLETTDSQRGATAASVPVTETMALASKDFPSKYAHFVTATTALLVPADREHLRLNVDRANVFQDSLESMAIIPLQNVHSVLRINFLDENGVDAGGLHREWFAMLNEMLVAPEHGLFVCHNKSEQTYCLAQSLTSNAEQLLYTFAVGRLLGRALLEGSMMSFHLAPPLLKLMLGHPLSFADVEDLDPELYANLLWMLENDGVDSLGLDFTVTVKDGESYRNIDLLPGGSSITVNDDNKHEYVERKWKYLLIESVAPQLKVFLKGLYEIIPRDLLLLFDPDELDFLLCGSDEIDVDDWERSTKYTEELHNHRALVWFWELVREMPNEYRRRLLQFATGSSRVPLGGFSALTSYDGRLCPFTLKAVTLVGDGFIHSHACFNRLDLPLHVVREELKAVLYAAIETDVYGFTTD